MKKYLSRDFLRKLDPAVYRAAAERIRTRRNDMCCFALDASSGDDWQAGQPYRAALRAAFVGSVKEPTFWNKQYTNERQHERHTALLLMAAMVETAKASRGKKRARV